MKYRSSYAYVLSLLGIFLIVYFRWLNFNVLSYADYLFQSKEVLKLNWPISSWASQSGLGGIDLTLWRAPFNILYAAFGNLGFASNIADRFLLLWPTILLLPISSFVFVKYIIKNDLAAFIGALVLSINTYFLAIDTQGHFLLTLAASFGILTLLFLMQGLEKVRLNYIVIAGLLLSITSVIDFRSAYLVLTVSIIFFIYKLLVNDRSTYKALITHMGVLFTFFVLTQAFWWLSLGSSGNISGNEILQRSLFGNGFWTLPHSLTLHHPFWNGTRPIWFNVSPVPIYFWLIPIFAFLGLYLNRKNKLMVLFGFISILGILLAKQVSEPFPGVYQWLFDHFPGFNAFREASKFYFLIALGYAVLIGSFVDWLWRHWTKGRWRIYGKYSLTVLIAGLFLWNTKPLITGEIGTLFVERHIPQDYSVLKDFIIKQPDYFRTYWLPRDSRWGIYTNNHPKISGVDIIQAEWKPFVNYKQHGNNWPFRDQIVDVFKKPYANNLLDSASVKYVIVPLRDTANDDDFFIHYGNDRQFYLDALNKAPYLKRIDIGTKDLVVYENTNYKPHISAGGNLVGIDNTDNLTGKYDFLSNLGIKNIDFDVGAGSKEASPRLKSLFRNPAVKQEQTKQTFGDSLKLNKSTKAKLYKNVAARQLEYSANGSRVELYSAPVAGLELNTNKQVFSAEAPAKLLGSVALEPGLPYFWQTGQSGLLPLKNNPRQSLGRGGSVKQLDLLTTAANQIPNPSFQQGLWPQQSGSDCRIKDRDGNVNVSLNRQFHTKGNQSVQLEATGRAVCSSKKFELASRGESILSFDYQSPDSKQASYYLLFNDRANTTVSDKLDVKHNNQWQTLTKKVFIPDEATTATLFVYASPTDGKAKNTLRYDNFNLGLVKSVTSFSVPAAAKDNYQPINVALQAGDNDFRLSSNPGLSVDDLDNAYWLLTNSQAETRAPKQIEYDSINPTKKSVAVGSASGPFALNFAESFHPGWELYLEPVKKSGGNDVSYLFKKPLPGARHFKLNGYANGWTVDPAYIKNNYSKDYYRENPDGSLDVNLTIYFKPQSYFYIGLTISGLTLLTCVGYGVYLLKRKQW